VLTQPRPVQRPAPAVTAPGRTLVVAVERDPANAGTVETLARQFAWGLERRGRSALDLPALLAMADAAGGPVPEALRGRLQAGLLDAGAGDWLRAAGIRHVVFLEVRLWEEGWVRDGKRARVALAAAGHDLADERRGWVAHAAPEVEEEPGRGFQVASEEALSALLRVIHGEGEPLRVPLIVIPEPPLKVPW
jgi:hypothetical protein